MPLGARVPATDAVLRSPDPSMADLSHDLAALRRTVSAAHRRDIGYPTASDIDFTELDGWIGLRLNNVGDLRQDPGCGWHTRSVERAVITELGSLFGLDEPDRWGYVTSGGTEGILCGLRLGRAHLAGGIVYHSEAAHYSVPKSADLLGLPAVQIRVTPAGEMDYAHLADRLAENPAQPALIVATAGTTMTEAVDDVPAVRAAAAAAGVSGCWVHVDAALSGIPLALDGPSAGFGFTAPGAGADSLSVSGHKFLATPFPCGVVLARGSARHQLPQLVPYIGAADTTITGSRSGHAALWLWYALCRYGRAGHRHRANAARELAGYAVGRIIDSGWPAWRHPHAFTVVLATPPAEVLERWTLAVDGPVSHVVCMPGVTPDQIDGFLGDLAAVVKGASRDSARCDESPWVPGQAARPGSG